MSACFCTAKADGTRTCRASRVTEAGDLFCLHERTLEAAMREAITVNDAEPMIDAATLERARLKAKRVVRIVGQRGPHIRPCGNPACVGCQVSP